MELPEDYIPPAVPEEKKERKLTLWQRIVASKILFGSILAHLLFGAGATFYVVQQMETKRKTTFQGGPPTVKASSRALEHQVSMSKKKNTQSAPAQAKRIMTKGLAAIALPEMPSMPNASEIIPNRMAGMGGTGIGFGVGGGGGMGGGGNGFGFSLPPTMMDRCSASSRTAAIASNGGDPKDEEVIVKGLRWLKAHQNEDGSYGQEYSVAMTGLALLSFMGHCERPTSKEFGPSVRKAIDYLCEAGSSGHLAHAGGNAWVYEHGIGTYALSESYILTKEVKIAEVLKKTVRAIVEGQGSDGGWQYGFAKSGNGDTSVSGWQIQALKAAILTGLNIDGTDAAMRLAMNNIMRVRGGKGGFGYRTPEDKWSLTGVGVLALEVGRHERGLAVRQGLHFIVDEPGSPKMEWNSPDANLYAWYYVTQACFQYGGSPWHKWNRQFQPEIASHQSADGSWPETGAKEKSGGLHWTGTGSTIDAQVYRTSLCILMLEVYYRYLASSR